MFGKDYLDSVGVDAGSLKTVADTVESFTTADGRDFYSVYLYPHARDWVSERERIDEFCAQANGFFSKLNIRSLIKDAKSDRELDENLSEFIL